MSLKYPNDHYTVKHQQKTSSLLKVRCKPYALTLEDHTFKTGGEVIPFIGDKRMTLIKEIGIWGSTGRR
ncbi:MAG: hypothetical protein EOP34_01840 [Rickettsiales bacterium]|nr:MAG: hypothetical protein EOP34_01840 [Rickettsiales bacterium]